MKKISSFLSRSLVLLLLCVLSLSVVSVKAQRYPNPKREFRGAWIQCVNGQYLGKSPAELRQMLSSQLDVLKKAGINAILFQVRAEGDALYKSSYEPWSRYLTGQQGLAPAEGWDPLEWMVNQCHERGMEIHAWINPYRAKTKGTREMATNHYCIKHPDRYFQYGDLFIFNPALEANRMYTCMVIEDIITRYNVDGLHMDDYFYPYPENGIELPDRDYFEADPRGFSDINDWRRDNVNLLIRDIHNLIRMVRPWVKFGISPFGIYRNSPDGVNNEKGSATAGRQNYDDLYADVVLWQEKGWVDYLIPQIYWNIGTKVADYDVLCHWWNDYCGNRPLFIGQDVERTVKGIDPNDPSSHQMRAKYNLQRSLPNVKGSCQWYAAAVVNNPGNYRSVLEQEYHSYPALQPEMKFIDAKAPKKPVRPRMRLRYGEVIIEWKAPKAKKEMDKAINYVVYRFERGQNPDINNPANILTITPSTYVVLNDGNDPYKYTYLVTALDHTHNESKAAKVK